ncbi:MarR family winged helix-turn-helix transcriptional regulator [Maribacter sp. HTCC2170]|uniref:MarR family winged helix-turn-helix transcriptional regulator n=1 Tax=Maribacter sp. (strain HTCC2170 / KCCM 42371) TaxID=313603 RepID=UPI00006AFC66|nr:MarR family winged helix-turn-helix transcriptional regulator [Maribacter sp. HTCC2170]EAR01248.1 transcriptional regulator [Maribacter sp. HTCC2170]
MGNSIFNPSNQESDISSKIVAGLERISEAFKVLLWEKAKLLGLSPIQIQILIFISYHKNDICNVSHLAKEFNITKPTISDAIRVLDKKGMITKDYSSTDSRSYSIRLSNSGKNIVKETEDFANPIQSQLKSNERTDLETLFKTLSKLIYQLNQNEILTVQRTCYGCKFYSHSENKDYCNLLNSELLNSEIRLDCPEFEEKTA